MCARGGACAQRVCCSAHCGEARACDASLLFGLQISVYFIYDSQDNFKVIDTPAFIVSPDGSYAAIPDAIFVPVEDPDLAFCSMK